MDLRWTVFGYMFLRYLCHKIYTVKKEEIIYGFQPVLEAIKAGKEIETLFLQKTLHPGKLQQLKKHATEFQVPFQFVPREKLMKLTRQNHQGVVAIVSPISYVNIDQLIPMLFESGKPPFLLILDKITDVRNVGAIARSAECAGVDALILPSRGSAMINSDAVKTSAGAITRLSLCRVSNLKDTIQLLKDSGISIIGTKENTESLYHQADYKIPVAIIIGSEEKGVSEEYIKLCNNTVNIPLLGEIQSLNVSVAAGIILFEAVKQRQMFENNNQVSSH